MEYAAFGPVQAPDSGGVLPFRSSEEPEGGEPDGLRFDRERACRLWEAASEAQPVGREEGECERRVAVSEEGVPSPACPLCGSGRSARLHCGGAPRLCGPTPGLPARPLA